MFPDRGMTRAHHPHGAVTRRGTSRRRPGTVPQELGEDVTQPTPNRYTLPLPQRQENRALATLVAPFSRCAAIRTVVHRKAPQSFAVIFQSKTAARPVSPPELARLDSDRAPHRSTRVVRFLHHSNRPVDRYYVPSRPHHSSSGGKERDSSAVGLPSQALDKPVAQDRSHASGG